MARAQQAAGYRVQSATQRRRWYPLVALRAKETRRLERLEQLERLAERQRVPEVDPRTLMIPRRCL